jgi:outer membrane protein OmpA-like peptidoglycan-associated protein
LDDTKPILIPTDLLFQFNQSELQESARLSMMKLGLLIKRNKESKFTIEGHTDTIGSEEYNMTLSLKRARSVQDWLAESLGLGEDRVSIRGFGETRPLVPDGDRDAQAINRRVEIAIKPTGA